MAKPTKPDQSKVVLNLDEKEIAQVVSQLRKSQRNDSSPFDNSPEALLAAEQEQEEQLKKLFGKIPKESVTGDDDGLERNWALLQKRMAAEIPAKDSSLTSLDERRKRKRQGIWLGSLTAVAAAALITVVTTFSPQNVTDTSLPTFKGPSIHSTIDCSPSWESRGKEAAAATIAADHQTYQLTPLTPYTLSMTCTGGGYVHGVLALEGKSLHEFRNESLKANTTLKVTELIPATWKAGTLASLTLFVTAEPITSETGLAQDPGTLRSPNQVELPTQWSDRIPLTVTVGQP